MFDPIDVGWPARFAFFCALAFGGALSSLAVWTPTTRGAAFAGLCAGTAISVVTAPIVAPLIVLWVSPVVPIPTEAIQAAAYFWIGLLGLKLVPVVLGAIKLLKSIRIGGSSE